MTIRTFEAGDEAAQAAIYNTAAAKLPKFKPANADEVKRRTRAADFDPKTRFYAVEGSRPVGYATFHANGRVSYPWCLPGHEKQAGPLFQAVLKAMRACGMTAAFAAYRADWKPVKEFFLGQGFQQTREMVNFVIELVDLPTPVETADLLMTPVRSTDMAEILALAPQALRVRTPEALARHLLENPYFDADAVFALRARSENKPLVAAGVVVERPPYADPRQVDAGMPCFRLGAFGTEGMQTKRINGLFSFLVRDDANAMPLGLDVLSHATHRLRSANATALAAQVPSDAPHLLRFYERYFHRQGSFPVFERSLS